ncbi:MAG: PAS domain-containing sensor histidine kinase, partial [Desulfobacteraceae bacterium]|nr:PAS domain-containing sensor histidine kinase [Desulfobacteraceae bacterium]
MFHIRKIKLEFRNQIYLVMFSLLMLLGIVSFFIVSRIMQDAMIEENKNRAVSIGVNLSARLIEPILTLDYFSMKKLVDETVLLSDDIYYTFVLDQEDNPVIHSFQNGFPAQLVHVNTVNKTQTFSQQYLNTGEHLVYDYALPISVDTNRLGTLRLGLLTTRVEKITDRIMITTLFSTLLSILVAARTGFFLFRPMTRNIKKLHEASEQAMRG